MAPQHTPSRVPSVDVEDSQLARLRDANEQLTLTTLQAQEDLDESVSRYGELVDGLEAIVWEANADTWRYTFVSGCARSMLGYTPERWLQEPEFWVTLIHPEDRQQAVAVCRGAAAARKDVRLVFRVIAADGQVRWLKMVARLHAQETVTVQYRGLLLDVSEAKRAVELQQHVRELTASEADLRERNAELEILHDLVVERELRMLVMKRELAALRREVETLAGPKRQVPPADASSAPSAV